MEALWAFLGGLVGSALSALGAWRMLRQNGRVEWRHRLDWAVSMVNAPDPFSRKAGWIMLAELTSTSLGSEEDRALARRIAQDVTIQVLDEPDETEDNGTSDGEEDQ